MRLTQPTTTVGGIGNCVVVVYRNVAVGWCGFYLYCAGVDCSVCIGVVIKDINDYGLSLIGGSGVVVGDGDKYVVGKNADVIYNYFTFLAAEAQEVEV